MTDRAICLLALILAAGGAGCGGGSSSSVEARQLAASVKSVLVSRYHVASSATVQCGSGRVHGGDTRECTALSSAGRGYDVTASLPCWTARFNGKIIEGPGFLPPGRRPPKVPTGPDNLPDRFAGCVK